MGINDKCLIVALTAYETEMFKQKSKQYGMDDFITKPISSSDISRLLSLVDWISC